MFSRIEHIHETIIMLTQYLILADHYIFGTFSYILRYIRIDQMEQTSMVTMVMSIEYSISTSCYSVNIFLGQFFLSATRKIAAKVNDYFTPIMLDNRDTATNLICSANGDFYILVHD